MWRQTCHAFQRSKSSTWLRLYSTAEATSSSIDARVAKLFPDEQYIVRLFQGARHSVGNIRALAQASPLQLDPTRVLPGTASAFAWDREHIVTNYHVVQESKSAAVTFPNQPSRAATVVGVDAANDLAVLKLQGGGPPLQPIQVGTSHDLAVGQKVFAIGNPFGLDQSLSQGIISSVGRQMRGVIGRTIRDVIQTDAAINPGNSGGPLLDSQGRLIGINTAIQTYSGTSAGVSFAVPVNTVRRSVTQLIRHGRLVQGVAGIYLWPDQMNINLLQQLGLAKGVVIQSLTPGGGGEQAGLRACSVSETGRVAIGDIIVEVGREEVCSAEDVRGIIELFNVGDQVPITVLRRNERLTINVPLLPPPQQ